MKVEIRVEVDIKEMLEASNRSLQKLLEDQELLKLQSVVIATIAQNNHLLNKMSNYTYAYVHMFGQTRYCKVTKTDLAKQEEERTFTRESIYYILENEDWHDWHYYKNKCYVAVTRENWQRGRVEK